MVSASSSRFALLLIAVGSLTTNVVLAQSLDHSPKTSGLYIGGALGMAWDKNTFVDVQGFVGYGENYTIDYDGAKLLAGAIIGYDWQLDGATVGIEADISKLYNSSSAIADPVWLDETVSSTYSAVATVRGRVSARVAERLNLFGTAGVALGSIKNKFVDYDYDAVCDTLPEVFCIFDPDDSFSKRSTRVGWVVGGGLDWELDSRWSTRLELHYLDFGTDTNYVNQMGFISERTGEYIGPQRYDIDNHLLIARMALIRRF